MTKIPTEASCIIQNSARSASMCTGVPSTVFANCRNTLISASESVMMICLLHSRKKLFDMKSLAVAQLEWE